MGTITGDGPELTSARGGWEQHTCLRLAESTDIGELERYRAAGVSFVSVNVGFSIHDIEQTMRVLASFRTQVERQPDFVLASSMSDVRRAQAGGQLAVAFDLEDCNPLAGSADMVGSYYALGVRSMAVTYNYANAAGHGCREDTHEGLTGYGRRLVSEMNRVGMVVDGSHTNIATSLDLCAASEQPVVFSHTGMRAVFDHPRNITDMQAKACAATGGVVGIFGLSHFLGTDKAQVRENFVHHLDHAVQLVGPTHVGVGLDYVFDLGEYDEFVRNNPQVYGTNYLDVTSEISFVAPEDFGWLSDALRDRGYDRAARTAILGGNFARVAQAVWRSEGA